MGVLTSLLRGGSRDAKIKDTGSSKDPQGTRGPQRNAERPSQRPAQHPLQEETEARVSGNLSGDAAREGPRVPRPLLISGPSAAPQVGAEEGLLVEAQPHPASAGRWSLGVPLSNHRRNRLASLSRRDTGVPTLSDIHLPDGQQGSRGGHSTRQRGCFPLFLGWTPVGSESPRPGCSRETGAERHLQVLTRWPGSGPEHLTWRDRRPLSAVPRAQAKVSVPLPTSSRATDPQTHCPRTPVA